jgi:hypothetical protein
MRSSHLVATVCSVIILSTVQIFGQESKNEPPKNTEIIMPHEQKKPEAEKSKVSVDRLAICLNIKDNEPDVIDSVFPPQVRRLYCFTSIKGASEMSEIQHRWYYNDDLQSTVSLKIGSASWRTYSAKSIPSVYTGEWIVAIVNSKNEEVIKVVKFFIKP